METLLEAVGNPHHAFEALHIAGTNGKGSTAAFASALCAAANVRVGRTTSPHLTSATERIVIDGRPISPDAFVALEQEVFNGASTLDDPPTFYERMVAMAFLAFAHANVPLAIVEVGLGGRLDATNVVRPRACAITRIGLDHRQFLGDTLDAIAREKAGIIKEWTPVVTSPQLPEAMAAIHSVAAQKKAPLIEAAPCRLPLSLSGAHQAENAGVAVELVRSAGLALTAANIEAALLATKWPGRFECFVATSSRPLVVLDGAHNADAARALAETLVVHPHTQGRSLHLVVGATRGHDAREFRDAFESGLADKSEVLRSVTTTKARAPRSVDAALVAEGWRGHSVETVAFENALAAAIEAAPADAVIVVTGSLYLVGEVRATLTQMPEDPLLPDF